MKTYEITFVVNCSTHCQPSVYNYTFTESTKTVLIQATDFTDALIKLSKAYRFAQSHIISVKRYWAEVVK